MASRPTPLTPSESHAAANLNGAGQIPHHMAIIMDGNGRWAEERGLSRHEGHKAGTENLRRIITAVAERGVSYLTFFAFSTENWKRPRQEVNPLLRLVGRVIDKELKALHEQDVRLVHLGSLDGLSPNLQGRVRDAIDLTRNNTGLTVCVAFNYGGRAEIVEAVRRIVKDGLKPEQISEAAFAHYLDTRGIPDPDLVVRTAGEMRISNFLLWQTAYAEFYATSVYWPDFDERQVDLALEAYARRSRRFGGSQEVAARLNGARNGSHISG